MGIHKSRHFDPVEVHYLQVQYLLWTFFRVSVGQDSHLPIQLGLHIIRFSDPSTSDLRFDTSTPETPFRVSWGVPRFGEEDPSY
jgi:hypothetical protein